MSLMSRLEIYGQPAGSSHFNVWVHWYEAGTASWMKNVGNDRQEVLLSVVTTSWIPWLVLLMDEHLGTGKHSTHLHKFCIRTETAVLPVSIISSVDLHVCLGIIMALHAKNPSRQSHSLYGIFMTNISKCIFEWDKSDYALMKALKCKTVGAEFAIIITRSTQSAKISASRQLPYAGNRLKVCEC